MNHFEWTTPRTIDDAITATSTTVADAMVSRSGRPSSDAVIFKAGGIDILDLMKEGLLTPRRVVNVRTIPGLDRIDEQDGGALRVGAHVTLAQLAVDPRVRQHYRALADAVAQSASPQIRQVATIGGNLLQRPRCWYFRSRHHHCVRKGGDSCFAFAGENQHHAIFDHNGCAIVHPSTAATVLMALGASVALTDAKATPRIVRLDDFLVLPETDIQRENDLRPGELLTAILLPRPAPGVQSVHLRQGEKDSFDWPLADVAVALDIGPDRICRGATIVLGAAAPVPHRAKAAEAAVIGKFIDEDVARAAGSAALAGAAPLTRNAYKLPIFETLVRRAVLAANGAA
jgi:xanthine dehydrogenase YagS FAD-binding subunit